MRWQNYKYQILLGSVCFILAVALINQIVTERLVLVNSQRVHYESIEPDQSISQTGHSCICPKQSCPKITNPSKLEGFIDWRKFISSKNITIGTGTNSYCPDLFQNMKNKKHPYSPSYESAKEKFIKYLKGVMKQNNLTRIEGNSGDITYQHWFYWTLGSHPSVKTVCEIGFNAGNSALVWLESNPNTKLFAFDINRSKYTGPMVKYFKKSYPGRVEEHFGDSTETVPEVALKGNVLCDIAVVDGGHFKDIPFKDIVNMKSLSKKNTILLVDDTATGAISNDVVMDAVTKLENAGYIERIFMCAYKIRGFAAFIYL